MSFLRPPETDVFPTLREELEAMHRSVIHPLGAFSLVVWLPFLDVDLRVFHPAWPVVMLRLGLSLAGVVMLLHRWIPALRAHAYRISLGSLIYLALSSAVIVGLSHGHAGYLGGLSMVLILLAIIPLDRNHALPIHLAALATFGMTATWAGLDLRESATRYGLYNLAFAAAFGPIAIQWFHAWRAGHHAHRLELRRTTEALAQANRLKGELMAMASHDLKNPLNLVLGHASLLEGQAAQGQVPADDLQESLQPILRASHRMNRILRRMLRHGNLDTEGLPLDLASVDLTMLVRNMVEEVSVQAEAKGQRIQAQLAQECRCQGDALCLEEVVENLLGNAVKYAPRKSLIQVTLQQRDGRAVFTVTDQGPGFTEADREHLFSWRKTLSALPTGGETSHGLGLAISKRLVEAHGGTLRLISPPGTGATFEVQI